MIHVMWGAGRGEGGRMFSMIVHRTDNLHLLNYAFLGLQIYWVFKM